MRAIVLTSTMRRHCFVANTVAASFDVACVWQEEKAFQPLAHAATQANEIVIQRHFDARDASEEEYFAAHGEVHAATRRLPPGGCNLPEELAVMQQAGPDVVLVFGTGLLKAPLIDAFDGRIINIHLGLSPYYRGAGTNFWPLVNREPEYCGATIHFLDRGVDSGPVILHVRPDIRRGDGPHDIGNQIIVAAAGALVRAARAHVEAPLHGVPQDAQGRVYKRADFTAAAVKRLYSNFADGMIDDYLATRETRDPRVRLVTGPLEARAE